jgi:hypothetical protein
MKRERLSIRPFVDRLVSHNSFACVVFVFASEALIAFAIVGLQWLQMSGGNKHHTCSIEQHPTQCM